MQGRYPMEIWENQLATEINSGGFQLSIVAASAGVGPVKYIIRIEKPDWDKVDYVSSLEGFKKLGELFLDLHAFAKDRAQIDDNEKLKAFLTAENIKKYTDFKKPLKISP